MDKKVFILSDESVNSYGFRINLAKLHLDRFKNNPVMLYNHMDLVGKWENIKIEDGKLMAEPSFMEDESEQHALKIKKRVENNFVKGASLGINILSVEQKEGEAPLVEAEVFECSVCDIPSNANSITLYDKEGVKLEGDAFNLAINSITTNNTTKDRQMKLNAKSYVALGLTEKATDAQVDEAIEKLQKENVDLKATAEADKKAKVESLISTALSEGRFTSDKKESFEKLANQDFDLAKSTIAELPTKKTLAGKEKSEGGSNPSDRDNWTFEDWRKKDTAGLLAIKKDDPERYKQITEG